MLLQRVSQFNEQIQDDLERSEKELVKHKDIVKRTKELVSLGEMAGGIAHEVNNPLQIIWALGYCCKVCIGRPDCSAIDRSQQSVPVIGYQKITYGLLHFSREGDQNFANHDINELLRGVLVLCQIKAKKHDVEITSEVESRLDEGLYCNDVQIGQVLINLFNNAMDYMVEDQIESPWIRCVVLDQKDYVEFRGNAGKKMSPDLQKKIFDPFFTTKEIGKGTGLGQVYL